MRKIEKNMIRAITEHANWREANTQVTRRADGVLEVRLHGHLIAVLNKTPGGYVNKIVMDTCGWHTRTTTSRLHALLSVFAPGFAVGLNKGVAELRDFGRPFCTASFPHSFPHSGPVTMRRISGLDSPAVWHIEGTV